MSEEQSPTNYEYMNGNHHTEYQTPIDLSRRRDSVETRKTPSPYNSSNFGGSSPSFTNDSPTTSNNSHMNNGSLPSARDRSDTPTTHHYQTSHMASNFCQTQQAYSPAFYPFVGKRESPSPNNDETMRNHHIHPNVSMMPQTPEEINAYLLHAVALQQKMVAQSHQMQVQRSDSNESSEMNSTMIPQSPSNNYPMVIGRDGKLSRPFKAYPRDPLSISATISAADTMLDRTSADKYQLFRKEMLEQIHAANGGQPTVSNPKMRRMNNAKFAESAEQKFEQNLINQEHHNSQSDSSTGNGGAMPKDIAYFERRKKNNAAAKKSRDRRRIKEDEIAIRAAFLERENIELKYELAAMKRQLSKFIAT